MNTAEIIAFTSLGLTMSGILWNIFFGYAKVMGKIDVLQNDMTWLKVWAEKVERRLEKVEDKLDDIQKDLHKIDGRVTRLEQKNPKS